MTNRLKQFINDFYLNLIFFISFLGFLGSLYFSEVEDFPPCDLCWYQRALLYPIFPISLIGLITKDKNVWKYILPFSLVGMPMAFYQYLTQKTDWFITLGTCSPENPCSEITVEYFGFITIPFMSFIAFAVVNVLILLYLLFRLKSSSED
ncbi:MAG: disulfide bond formation protein B [Candidatus Dojkabacteria bacterium]